MMDLPEELEKLLIELLYDFREWVRITPEYPWSKRSKVVSHIDYLRPKARQELALIILMALSAGDSFDRSR